MAQFRGTITGSRDTTISKLGHKTTGLMTECNGWNVGITCIAEYRESIGKDVISVYRTNGSSNKKHWELIVEVTNGKS